MVLSSGCVNHSEPSGPAVIPSGARMPDQGFILVATRPALTRPIELEN